MSDLQQDVARAPAVLSCYPGREIQKRREREGKKIRRAGVLYPCMHACMC
jgi:hypothetical protein